MTYNVNEVDESNKQPPFFKNINMDNLSRDVFGNIIFNKHVNDNKSFSNAKMKVYLNYNCLDYSYGERFSCKYYPFENFRNIEFEISLN